MMDGGAWLVIVHSPNGLLDLQGPYCSYRPGHVYPPRGKSLRGNVEVFFVRVRLLRPSHLRIRCHLEDDTRIFRPAKTRWVTVGNRGMVLPSNEVTSPSSNRVLRSFKPGLVIELLLSLLRSFFSDFAFSRVSDWQKYFRWNWKNAGWILLKLIACVSDCLESSNCHHFPEFMLKKNWKSCLI